MKTATLDRRDTLDARAVGNASLESIFATVTRLHAVTNEEPGAREVLARMRQADSAMLARQPRYKRLVRGLSVIVRDFTPGSLYAETFLHDAIASLDERGSYDVPSWASPAGEKFTITDDATDTFLTAGDIASRLGVSKTTALRHMGAPDVVLGRTYGWRVSTMRARVG